MIPFEVCQYEFDGETFVSEIEDFEIVRRQTNEKSDISDCIITLADERLERTVYITFNSSYWDTGGWMCESYEITRAEDYKLMDSVVYDTDRFLAELNMLGFYSVTQTCVEEKPGYSCCEYTIGEEYPYLSCSGIATGTAELQRQSDAGKSLYNWRSALDTSNISYEWTISGHWRAENVPEFIRGFAHHQLNWFELNISEAVIQPYSYYDGYFSYQYEYEEDAWSRPQKYSMSGVKTDGIELYGETPINMYLELGTLGHSEYSIRIYPSYAEMANKESTLHGLRYGKFAPLLKVG